MLSSLAMLWLFKYFRFPLQFCSDFTMISSTFRDWSTTMWSSYYIETLRNYNSKNLPLGRTFRYRILSLNSISILWPQQHLCVCHNKIVRYNESRTFHSLSKRSILSLYESTGVALAYLLLPYLFLNDASTILMQFLLSHVIPFSLPVMNRFRNGRIS